MPFATNVLSRIDVAVAVLVGVGERDAGLLVQLERAGR